MIPTKTQTVFEFTKNPAELVRISLSVDLLDDLKEALNKAEACMNGGGRGSDHDTKATTSREDRPERTEDE